MPARRRRSVSDTSARTIISSSAGPWVDGPTALAALIDDSDDMRLATTASLPVLRGPVQLAKTLVAIDILSGGRLVVGVGPGSSAADYAAAGLGFGEWW